MLKKALAKLGYSINEEELSVIDAQAFILISSEFSKLESQEMKRKGRKK